MSLLTKISYMDISITTVIKTESTVHIHDGQMKNHPGEIGGWWGEI